MTFTHQFGVYHVTNSINFYIRQNLGTNVPQWMTWNYGVAQPRTLNFNYPDQPLNFPSFSVTHHQSRPAIYSEGDVADAGYRGIIRQGQMEINCWAIEIIQDSAGNTTKNEKWMLQLQQMRDMVFLMFQKRRNLPMYDCTDPNNLVPLNYIVRITDMQEAAVLPDPNPAVKRTRILINYRWTERWTPP